jgi:hypothetical protein
MSPQAQAALGLLIALAVVIALGWTLGRTATARRLDYPVGSNVVVRCRAGHLFTTIWVPGISLKAIRLGLVRFQYCPVGQHWTFVVLLRKSDLTDEERRIAERYHDTRIP